MSKIKLTGSNSGYVEIASAADAGNLTLTLPTGGTALLGNAGNVFSGITTTGQLDINGSIDVSSTSVFNDDLTLTGASYNAVWDKSDNQLEFGDNAKLSFGGDSDMQLYHVGGANSYIVNKANNLYVQSNNAVEIGSVDTNGSSVETSAKFIRNGSSELYFNDVKKFQTTNTGAIVTGICTATSFSGSGEGLTRTTQLSHRNLIINGAMRVAQRSTSTTSSSGVGTVDRVIFYYGGIAQHIPQAQVDVSSGTTPYTNGFRKAFKVTNANQGTAGSDDTVVILYRIEAQDLANSGWNYTSSSSYITLSYWVKSSVQQNFYVTLKSGDGTTQKYATETGSLSANTWTKVTKTIPGNSNITFNNDNGEGLEIEWSLYRGTDQTGSMSLNAWAANNNAVRTPDQPVAWFQTNGATFELTGVQLEVGQQATPFEHRSFGEELERCRRYYQVILDRSTDSGDDSGLGGTVYQSSAGALYVPVRFNPPMRTKPTVESSSAGNEFRTRHGDLVNFTSFTGFNTVSRHGGTLIASASGNKTIGHYYWIETDQGSAKLAVSAEL